MLMLKVDNLTVGYGQLTVVRDVSFSVSEGEIVSLVGANGAGKSSVINAISGVIKQISGSVEFGGKNIDALTPWERVELGLCKFLKGVVYLVA